MTKRRMAALLLLICFLLFLTNVAHAFPTASDTGINATDCPNWDSIKTNISSPTITTNGTTIQNAQVSGTITINAANVTIKCVKITSPGTYGINCFTNNSCGGALMENVEISNCQSSCINIRGKAGQMARVNKGHFHHSINDLVKIESYSILENSYLHDFIPTPVSHNDAIQTSSGTTIDIRYNDIVGHFKEQTSAWIAKSDFGGITNIRLLGNRLSGGTYTLYLNRGDNFPTPNQIVVRDNVWVKDSWKNGPLSLHQPTICMEWINNKFSDGSNYTSGSSPENTCTTFTAPSVPTDALAPAFSPPSGGFIRPILVSLNTATNPPYEIRYTTNGTTPTSASTLYGAPIAIDSTVTMKAITIKSGLTDSAVSTATYTVNNFTSASTWQSAPFLEQNQSFRAKFVITPSSTPIDAVTGLSPELSVNDYSDLAILVRFNTSGYIDAINGSGYSAVSPVPYGGATPYTVELSINLPARTYSATVTPEGSSTIVLARDYRFRTEQTSANALSRFAVYAATGTHNAKDFHIIADHCP